MPDPEEHARQLAAESLAADDPTGWFERLYAEAQAGLAVVPWDRGAPHRHLVQWAADSRLDGAGQQAIVVGCGLGDDAEFIADLGFETVAFDISASAIAAARRRFPGSSVQYRVTDLLDPPDRWIKAFGLVVESMTLQALPDPPRPIAVASVGKLVAPGGTLLVLARARDQADPDDGPPWALTEAEIVAAAQDGLRLARIEDIREDGPPPTRRWRAELSRPVG